MDAGGPSGWSTGAAAGPPDMVDVELPSGAHFPVHSREVAYLTDLATRYMADNHFCLPAGVAVSTTSGPVDIETVVPGTEVWTISDGITAKAEVTAVHRPGPKEVVVLRTRNRRLRASPGHKVLTWVTRPSRAKRVGNRGRLAHEYTLEWVPAGEIQVGDRIVIHEGVPEGGSERCPTRWVSEGFAEFCGLFTGDGLTVGHRYVRITRDSEANYMDHYRKVALAEFQRADGSTVALYERPGYTEFGSSVAAAELEALGLCGGSRRKRVPPWVFGLDAKRRAAYLRGYLDADGCVNKLGRMQFLSPNEALIRDIWHLCISLGIAVANIGHAWISTNFARNVLVHRFIASDAAANASVVGSHDKRYLDRWATAKPIRRTPYTDRYGRGLTPPEGCGFARVKGITREPPCEMYDLTVRGSHVFIADGVVTHNSNISDLQDVDRMLLMELMCFRWGVWLSQGADYDYRPIDADAIEKSLKNHSAEVRQLKTALDITKRARDKARGEDSVPVYLANLLARAKEFAVFRETQLGKALELFNELKALITLHQNCDAIERAEMHMEVDDVLEWIVSVAIPEYDQIDAYFRAHQQRFWIRTL